MSYKFFSNKKCEYYPCHNINKDFKDLNCSNEDLNCLFCYCPLYRIKECGGDYEIMNSGVKDCSKCLIPHTINGYPYIIRKLEIENLKQFNITYKEEK